MARYPTRHVAGQSLGEPERCALGCPFDRQVGRAREALTVERWWLSTLVDRRNDIRGQHRQAEEQCKVLERVARGPGDIGEACRPGGCVDRIAGGKRIGEQLDQRRVRAGLQDAVGSRDQLCRAVTKPATVTPALC